jgi:hypothetical protein
MEEQFLIRKRRLLIIASVVLGFIALLVALSLTVLTDFLVDLWWYGSLGYGSYFWARVTYRYLIFAGSLLLFFGIFFGNLWYASRQIDGSFRTFRLRSLWFSVPVSLILALLISSPLAAEWEQSLLFLTMPDAGVLDPMFNRDVSYYFASLRGARLY